jgi:thioredoxin-dependent peroxiredoxin
MRAWLFCRARAPRRALPCRLGLVLGLALGCRGAPQPEQTEARSSAPEKPLVAGDPAPEFRALSHIGYSVSARDFGQQPVLVQLCPDGFDASCAQLARSVRDHWLTLNRRLGMALFVAPLGLVEGRAFASAEELPFLVLADSDRAVTRAFGVHDAKRVGFLLGPEQRIERVLAAANAEDYVRELSGALP